MILVNLNILSILNNTVYYYSRTFIISEVGLEKVNTEPEFVIRPLTITVNEYYSTKFQFYAPSPGVGLVWRGLAATATPTQEWTRDGDKINIKTTSLATTHEQKFTLGKEFDETRIDGEQCKV